MRFLLWAVVEAILVLGLWVGFQHMRVSYSQAYKAVDGPLVSPQEVSALSAENRAFQAIAKAVLPGVVNISTTRMVKTNPQNMFPFFNDPLFRQFFGPGFQGTPQPQKEQSLGSGIIISPNGYIVTNNHVIDQATEIKVTLADKRELKGKLVGTDPKTDIAVIKIEASGLSVVPWGDSRELKPGEIVMAFGSPFGLNQTVTKGIVSATGRSNIGIENYEDFIQTDAAINPGNSGGPLVNINGELVGINTAILSAGQSMTSQGGFNGIGFAIPSNMARPVAESLIRNGKVVRAWLGVTIENVTPAIARTSGLKEATGAIVSSVEPGSPAAEAGIKRGDIVLDLDGAPIENRSQLAWRVSQTPLGQVAHLKVWRGDSAIALDVKVAEMPKTVGEQGENAPPEGGEFTNVLNGISVQNLTREMARQLNLPMGTTGVVITDVKAGSAADDAGLQRGDVIQEVNRQEVRTVDDFNRIAAKIGKADTVLLLVNRGGSSIYIGLSVEGQ
ncbi:MAG: DegQ family serine endoprotease [Acidobacteriia bacterium]|nr:DegQ family serine endoprotease [Terriglobia bacterium]